MSTSAPERTRASALFALPWYSKDFLLQHEWCEGYQLPLEIKSFLNNMMAYEHQFYQSYDMIDLGVKKMLQYSPPFTIDANGAVTNQIPAADAGASPTKSMTIRYHSLITAYRVVDALVMYQGEVVPRTVPRTLNSTPSSWERWDRLHSVKTVLMEFFATLEIISQDYVDKDDFPDDVMLWQMKSLATVKGRGHLYKIQSNILIAAFNLSCMWRNSKFNSFPALPEDMGKLLEGYDSHLGPSERSILSSLFESKNLAAMRRPLQIAANISPLALLLNLELDKQRYSEAKIFEDSKAIGTHNFDLLHQVEKAIWDAVIHVATGKATVLGACVAMFNRIMTWESQIRTVADDDPMNIRFVIRQGPSEAAPTHLAAVYTIEQHGPEPQNYLQVALSSNPFAPPEQNNADISLHPYPEVGQGLRQNQDDNSMGGSPAPGDRDYDMNQDDSGQREQADEEVDTRERSKQLSMTLPAHEEDFADEQYLAKGIFRRLDEDSDDDEGWGKEQWKDRNSNDCDMDQSKQAGDIDLHNESKQTGDIDLHNESKQAGDIDLHNESEQPGDVDMDNESEQVVDTDSIDSDQEQEADQNTHQEEPIDEDEGTRKETEVGEQEHDQSLDQEDQSMGEEEGAETKSGLREQNIMHSQPAARRKTGEDILSKRGPTLRASLRPKSQVPSRSSGHPPNKKRQRREDSSADSSLRKPYIEEQTRHKTPFTDPTTVDTGDQMKEPNTLNATGTAPKIQAATAWKLFDAKGNTHEYRPAVHHRSTLNFFEGLLRAAEVHYVDGLPPHAAPSAQSSSVFSVVSHSAMQAMSHAEKLALFRQGHILETDRPITPFKFDKAGICSLGNPRQIVSIQDQSIKPAMNQSKRIRQGTLSQMLEASHQENGKILNALDFPMPLAPFTAGDLATDVLAWKLTKANPKGILIYPSGEMCWGLCATCGASTCSHAEPDGLPTTLDVMTGAKWWIVFRPKGCKDYRQFALIHQFHTGDFDIDKFTSEQWDIEAVLLTPGTRLYMRPNTIHAVFTPEHSICHGGHFYSTSTMQDTFYGIVHSFCSNMFITNTSHPETRVLLSRMIKLYHSGLVHNEFQEDEPVWAHIPNLKTMDSVLDLLSACNLAILSNALDFRTYTHPIQEADEPLGDEEKLQMELYDFNSMQPEDRVECTFSRGFALDLINWFSKHHILTKDTGTVTASESTRSRTESAIMDNLAHQAYAIWLAKEKAVTRGVVGAPNCTLEMLKKQLLGTLPLPAREKLTCLLQAKKKHLEMYMDWIGWRVLSIEISDAPVEHKNQAERSLEIWSLGMSSLDRKYAEGIPLKFAVDSSQETCKPTRKRRR